MELSQGVHQPAVHSYPDLPVDVARSILETTALLHRDSAHRLVCVSKTVREWIEPILYHTVILDGETAQRLFVESCESRLARDPDFCSKHVKALCIKGLATFPLIKYLLAYCSAVDIFAAWFLLKNAGNLYPIGLISGMGVRRLSLYNGFSMYIRIIPPTVTHLNLSYVNFCSFGWTRWEDLFLQCPHLTHVHFLARCRLHNLARHFICHIDGDVSIFKEALNAAPPSFKALIVEVVGSDEDKYFSWEGSEDVARNLMSMISDKRFVLLLPRDRFAHMKGIACYATTRDPTLDWGYRVSGELDAFEMADRHLATLDE